MSRLATEPLTPGSRVLLHVCCGPCSLMPVLHLRREGFEVSGFFFNLNIHPQAEYDARREAMGQAAQQLKVPLLWENGASEQPLAYAVDPERWVARLGSILEEGPRCAVCYADRLAPTARLATALGFDAFTTSLLYSRYQQHDEIVSQAEQAANAAGTRFLYRDFRPFWQEGINLSKELGLYRQKWCGCILSQGEAERQRAALKARRQNRKTPREPAPQVSAASDKGSLGFSGEIP